MRKLFARLDAAALDTALALFAWCRVRTVAGRRVIAIDGKTVRGARAAGIAALDHATGVVLGQRQVDAKSNEIPRSAGSASWLRRRGPARMRDHRGRVIRPPELVLVRKHRL